MARDYSEMPGYRHESDTSREAAEQCTTAHKNRRIALDFIKERAADGATIDEVCVHLSKVLGRQVPPNAISGRFKELEEQGVITKTPMRRQTRSGRRAVVYLAGSWKDLMPAESRMTTIQVTTPPEGRMVAPPSQVEMYKAKLRVSGHGHVIQRNDNRKEGCGGPGICRVCRMEKQYFENLEAKEKKDNVAHVG